MSFDQAAFDRGLDEYLEDQHNSYLQSLGGNSDPTDAQHPRCVGCGRRPADIPGYATEPEDADSPDEYAAQDGTFNPRNGHFYCDACYLKAGMPLGVAP